MNDEEIQQVIDAINMLYVYGPIEGAMEEIASNIFVPHNMLETRIGFFIGTREPQNQYEYCLIKKPEIIQVDVTQ